MSRDKQMLIDGIVADIKDWLGEEYNSYPDKEKETCVEQIKKAIERGDCGYSRAKYLDDTCSWEVDMELVEILDRF